jgi:hypothetical protein
LRKPYSYMRRQTMEQRIQESNNMFSSYSVVVVVVLYRFKTAVKELWRDAAEITEECKMNNEEILELIGATPLKEFIPKQQIKWFAHIVRSPNLTYIKKLTFTDEKNKRLGQPLNTLTRSIRKRFKLHQPSHILKACFKRTINKLVES